MFGANRADETAKLPYLPVDLRKKKSKKQQKDTFRHATRRKVIQATPGIFVTSKSEYGGKGKNPRKIRTKVLLTLRVSGRKVLFTLRAQIDR